MHRNLILFLTITLFFLTSCEEGFDLKSGITISEKNELYTKLDEIVFWLNDIIKLKKKMRNIIIKKI